MIDQVTVGYEQLSKFHSAELQKLVDDAVAKSVANYNKNVSMNFSVLLLTQITDLEPSPKFATVEVTSLAAAKKLASAFLNASAYIPITKKRITVSQTIGRNSQIKNKMKYAVKGVR
jgi:hypothetical protein